MEPVVSEPCGGLTGISQHTHPEVEEAIQPDAEEENEENAGADISTDVGRMVAESVGSFAVLKDSIQQLLTRLRVTSGTPPGQRSSPVWRHCNGDRKTAQVRPNQHRPDEEDRDKENDDSDWPRPAAGQREEHPTPWWSSEDGSCSDAGSPRMRVGEDGGGVGGYLCRLLERTSEERRCSDAGKSGRTRRRLFKSRARSAGGSLRGGGGRSRGRCSLDENEKQRNKLFRSRAADEEGEVLRVPRCGRGVDWVGEQLAAPGVPRRLFDPSLSPVATSAAAGGVASGVSRLAIECATTCVASDVINRRSPSSKYRARDVLMGKGELKLALYINCGLLTVFVRKAKKVVSKKSPLCNSYVKVEMHPKAAGICSCRTMPVPRTNSPVFNQKFSFELSADDESKRLYISIWHRDVAKRNSEFLGCMSFGVTHVLKNQVDGWYHILTERVGKSKHFAVQTRNLASILKRVRVPFSSCDSDQQRHQRTPIESCASKVRDVVATAAATADGEVQQRRWIVGRTMPAPSVQAVGQSVLVRAQIESCQLRRQQQQQHQRHPADVHARSTVD